MSFVLFISSYSLGNTSVDLRRGRSFSFLVEVAMWQNDWHSDSLPKITFCAIGWLPLFAHHFLGKWERNMRVDSLMEGETQGKDVDITIIRGN